MLNHALAMYESAVREVRTGRELEAAVLRNAASKLELCREQWVSSAPRELAEALQMNQAIWSIFQGDLLDAANELPVGLKANLLKLSVIVDRYTLDIQTNPEAEKLDLLIDINLAIAEGLAARVAALQLVPAATDSMYGAEAVCA